MKTTKTGLLFGLLLVVAPPVLAQDGHDGGDGTAQMPGCPGGTEPSKDGKFFLPGTDTECNPSEDDRKGTAQGD